MTEERLGRGFRKIRQQSAGYWRTLPSHVTAAKISTTMTMLPAFHSLNACSRIVHRAGRNSVLLCSRRHATTLVTSRNKSDRQSDPSPEPQTHKIRGKTIKSPQAVQKELAKGSQQARAERLWNEDMQRLMYDKDPDDKLAQLHAGHELIRSYGDSNSVPLPLLGAYLCFYTRYALLHVLLKDNTTCDVAGPYLYHPFPGLFLAHIADEYSTRSQHTLLCEPDCPKALSYDLGHVLPAGQ